MLNSRRTIREFQTLIEDIYFERDNARGIEGTTLWFVEEVGELVRALRRGNCDNLREEFGDCFAWLSSLASICKLDLADLAFEKYGNGCPRCRGKPCVCPEPSSDDKVQGG